MRQIVETNKAPAAIGNYSPAVKVGNTIYLAGQIPLDPATMTLVEGGIEPQVKRVFENIKHVVEASGCNMDEVVKLTVYLTDLANMPVVNEAIGYYFSKPFPARTSIQVSGLPKNAAVEVEATVVRL